MEAERADKQLHQDQVPEDGRKAGNQIESEKPDHDGTGAVAGPIRPGPAFMPGEIVQYGCFDGDKRGPKVVQAQAVDQSRQDQQLDNDAQRAHGVEPEPVPCQVAPALAVWGGSHHLVSSR